MKKLYILSILFIFNSGVLYSQLNDAATYLPLKPGNKWVYTYYNTQFGQSGRLSRQVNGSTVYNGHTYYSYEGVQIRVDSVNGNRYRYYNGSGCNWSPNDRMTDSLAARLNDTIKYDCGNYYKVCSDTNMRNLFGTLRRTKNFRLGNNGIIYAKNFGIIEQYTQSGMVFYTENLIGCVINGIVYGDTSLVGLNQLNSEIPAEYELYQNYPNPFNPATNIKFTISKSGFVKLAIYDMLGKEVQQLVNKDLNPGTYSADWDASDYPSGVYYYRLESENFTETKKMVLIK